MCRCSKNLRRPLNRHRLENRRWHRRHPTECWANRRSDHRRKNRRCSAKATRPRASPRQAAKYLQSHSGRKNRFVRRSNPSCHPRHRRTGRWHHRMNHPIRRLQSHRRPGCHRPAIHPSCHPTIRRHSGRRKNPDCRLEKRKTRHPMNHRRRSSRPTKGNHPNSATRRSNRHWACCSMSRQKIRRRSSHPKNPTIRLTNRRSACCSKASTMKKIAAAGSRP